MIDERFSKAEFDRRGLDSPGARALADQLSEEVLAELQPVLRNEMMRIVGKLNAMGHQLKPFYEEAPGEWAFRDDAEDETGYHCRLRLALDCVVSTGFAHLAPSTDD
jgi:hypothetical protein